MHITIVFVVTCVLVLAAVWESQQSVTSKIVVLSSKVPEYPIFIPNSDGLFKFQFRGSTDCNVVLTNGEQIIYRIIIGGWSNTKSVIRKMSEGVDKNLVEVKTPKIVSNFDKKGFWVSWMNSTISVGHAGHIEPFMTWHDADMKRTTHVGVSSAYISETCTWIIDTGNIHDDANKTEIATDNTYRVFIPFSSNTIRFSVRAKNNAYIALTNGNCVKYEVLIGGWDNRKTGIKNLVTIADNYDVQLAVASPGLLSADEYTSFWLNWINGTITVGRSGDPDPFITSCVDDDSEQVTHVAVSTGVGQTGRWKMDQAGMSLINVVTVVPNEEVVYAEDDYVYDD